MLCAQIAFSANFVFDAFLQRSIFSEFLRLHFELKWTAEHYDDPGIPTLKLPVVKET